MVASRKPIQFILGHKVTTTLRGEKYNVPLRGWRVNRYIITDLPSVNGENVHIAPQSGCTVNFVNDGWFINFKSTVMFCMTQAVSLMLIEYPRNYDIYNLRSSERYKSNVILEYSYLIGETNFSGKGVVRDLGISGILITHEKPLEKNSKVTFRFVLPNGNVDSMDGMVRNVRNNPKSIDAPYVTGVEWINISTSNNEILRQFLATRDHDRRLVRRG